MENIELMMLTKKYVEEAPVNEMILIPITGVLLTLKSIPCVTMLIIKFSKLFENKNKINSHHDKLDIN